MFSILIASALATVPMEEMAPILFDWAKPKYSHSEQHLAYLAPDEVGAYNLHVDGTCVTHERRAIFNFFWEKDDGHLLYLYDEKGDENYHLYRTDLKGNVEDLTPFRDVHVDFIGVDSQRALIEMNLCDPRYMDWYFIDLESKRLEPYFPQVGGRCEVLVEKDLQPRVAIRFESSGKKVLEVCEEGKWRSLWILDSDDWFPRLEQISPDRQKVFLLSSTGLPTRGVYVVDLQTGEKELLFSHPKLDCLKAYFHPEDGFLQATFVKDGLLEWHFFDPMFQGEIQSIEEKLGKGEVTLLSRLSQDRKWFISHVQDDRPNAYYLWDRDAGELTLVLQEVPQLLKYAFGTIESFHFRASDGQDVQGYFLKPPYGKPPYPTMLVPHGGPRLRNIYGFVPALQYWANRGIASLLINYRGSTGFGKQFMLADEGEWGGRAFQDLIDGKRWAEQQGWVDPKRTMIKGRSFGGYLALLGISKTPSEFVCGIADVPIVEPSSWMPLGYVVWDFIYDKLFREAAIGAKSPLSYAHQIQVPLLMTHAENDLRVHLSQSQKMAESLAFYHIPFRYYVVPGDGHQFLDPENRRFYFKEETDFLEASKFVIK